MKIIIIGCGRMGSGLAQVLLQRGHSVVVVDKDAAAFSNLPPSFKGQTITGIAFDRDILEQAGIEYCDGLAALTSSDEANVVTARVARQVFRVPRVVARLYDPRKAEIYRRLGLQTISTVTWGINRVAELLCYSQLDTIVSLGSGGVDLIEQEIPPLLEGHPVGELTVSGEISVVAISRGGKTFLPTLDTTFQRGDLVHLAALSASADHLKDLLGLN